MGRRSDIVKSFTKSAIDMAKPADTITVTGLNTISARPKFIAGNTKCKECSKIVSAHPTDEARPYLYVMCNGVLAETKKNNKPAAVIERKYKHKSPFAFRRLKTAKQR